MRPIPSFGTALLLGALFIGFAAAEDSAEVKKLLTERRDELRTALRLTEEMYKTGGADFGKVLEVSRLLLRAELALAEKPAERIATLQRHFKIVCEMEDVTRARYEAGQITKADLHLMRAERLSVEIELLRAGGKPERKKAKD
jgi:outer membrane protein TolC